MTPDRLAELHQLCFPAPARAWNRGEFEDLLDHETVFLSAHQFGFALGRTAGPEAELLTIAVDPVQRRKGIALALLQDFEEIARNRYVEEAFLDVAENNISARALYSQAGYVQVATRPGYYPAANSKQVDAVVMRKMLA